MELAVIAAIANPRDRRQDRSKEGARIYTKRGLLIDRKPPGEIRLRFAFDFSVPFPAASVMSILISCETGGDRQAVVTSRMAASLSEGDCDALHAAETLANGLDGDLLVNEYSPDLIDVSRSLRHRDLFSSVTKKLSDEKKRELIDQVHWPYRRRVAQRIASVLSQQQFCIHLSVRTFEAKYKGIYRRGDVGLGYDTSRRIEMDVCLDWIDDMYDNLIMLKVRRNFPRRGNVDSLTRTMRAEFAADRYLGIEVQLNQSWVGRNVKIRDEVLGGIAESFGYVVQELRRMPPLDMGQRATTAEAA